MRKIGLILGALLTSFNCFAYPVAHPISLSSDMSSAFKTATSQTNSGDKNLSIIYGGKDIATANEPIWTGQPNSTG